MIDFIFSEELIIKTKNPKKLKELLDLEMARKDFKRSESKITIDSKVKTLKIMIFAKDITAYKATINNYINLLELIKKTYEVDL
jgi:tRNA threonylcarbamoyladenosine modification (KEOPS) complex  Pcc1 subunit